MIQWVYEQASKAGQTRIHIATQAN
ncbi:UNVERIFIED_CONTAM: hypothetical protein GTU68_021512 [Idotea baltica]|nr:hypothetical protein [Idotea baltica]